MRSTARIKSHPIHPILVCFPIAFFTGTLVFDVLGTLYDDNIYRSAGFYMNLSGIIGAVLAAIAGVIDYVKTVPPKSSAKKRAAKHGITNTIVLGLFIFTLFYKQSEFYSSTIVLVVEFIAFILLLMAGWMGGTLVYRNEIGVDRRYADAGKWNEEYIDSGSSKIQVARSNELKTDQMKLIHYKGQRIVIAKTETGFVAFDDRCPHKGGSLAGGAMICGTVQCPWHGSQFDVHSGSIKAGPGENGIKIYPLHQEGDKLFLQI